MKIARACIFGLGLVLMSAQLLGCPGPTFIVQQYAGPVRPQSSIATLRVNGGDSVRLLALDDEDVAAPLDSDARLHIELLPARHTVIVGNAKSPRSRVAPIAFQAEPGKFYRVAFVAEANGPGEAVVYEVERGSDKPVRRVPDVMSREMSPQRERLDGVPTTDEKAPAPATEPDNGAESGKPADPPKP
jgi:hypothetical protein